MNTYDMMIGGDTDDMRIIPMACSRHSRDNIAHSEHNKYFYMNMGVLLKAPKQLNTS